MKSQKIQDLSDHILIAITDSGPGIEEKLRNKILQPFFATKALGKGTGLGLSISQKIVKAHNGILSIDSTIKNTCFTVKLPKKRSKE